MGISGCRENPFADTDDPRFYFESRAATAATGQLRDAIDRRQGCLLLIGPPGVGKTRLLRHLQCLEECEVGTPLRLAYSDDPSLGIEQLRERACEALDLPRSSGSGVLDGPAFNFHLRRLTKSGMRAALALDDAQSLPPSVLARLVDLSPADPAGGGYLLQVVLTGGPELIHLLDSPELRMLADRTLDRIELRHLEPDEVTAFIEHRVAAAGGSTADLFSAETIERIAAESEGLPHEILRLCREAFAPSAAADPASAGGRSRVIGSRKRRQKSTRAPVASNAAGNAIVGSALPEAPEQRFEDEAHEGRHEAASRAKAFKQEPEQTRSDVAPPPRQTSRAPQPARKATVPVIPFAVELEDGEICSGAPGPGEARGRPETHAARSGTDMSLASMTATKQVSNGPAPRPTIGADSANQDLDGHALRRQGAGPDTLSLTIRDGETLVLKLRGPGSARDLEISDDHRPSPVPSIAELAAGRIFPEVGAATKREERPWRSQLGSAPLYGRTRRRDLEGLVAADVDAVFNDDPDAGKRSERARPHASTTSVCAPRQAEVDREPATAAAAADRRARRARVLRWTSVGLMLALGVAGALLGWAFSG